MVFGINECDRDPFLCFIIVLDFLRRGYRAIELPVTGGLVQFACWLIHAFLASTTIAVQAVTRLLEHPVGHILVQVVGVLLMSCAFDAIEELASHVPSCHICLAQFFLLPRWHRVLLTNKYLGEHVWELAFLTTHLTRGDLLHLLYMTRCALILCLIDLLRCAGGSVEI